MYLHVQGALAAITELEDGHTGLVPAAQCIQYDLDTQSHSSARIRLHQAFSNIESPIKVIRIISAWHANMLLQT